jgi:hypothetical protein
MEPEAKFVTFKVEPEIVPVNDDELKFPVIIVVEDTVEDTEDERIYVPAPPEPVPYPEIYRVFNPTSPVRTIPRKMTPTVGVLAVKIFEPIAALRAKVVVKVPVIAPVDGVVLLALTV